MPTMKRCCTCRQAKPLTAFRVCRTTRDGVTATCRECLIRGPQWRHAVKHHVRPTTATLSGDKKICAACKKMLPVESFAQSTVEQDGRYPSCLTCVNARLENMNRAEAVIRGRIDPWYLTNSERKTFA